jgi:hypothetical protein
MFLFPRGDDAGGRRRAREVVGAALSWPAYGSIAPGHPLGQWRLRGQVGDAKLLCRGDTPVIRLSRAAMTSQTTASPRFGHEAHPSVPVTMASEQNRQMAAASARAAPSATTQLHLESFVPPCLPRRLPALHP